MILKNGKRIDGVSLDTTPIGTIFPYLGVTAPQGYLLCQGQKVSKIRYKQLYNICKSLFGAETDTEFYLPDLRGKTITGYKNGDSTFGTLGGLIGNLIHTHTTGNHTLTIAEMPEHTHSNLNVDVTKLVYDNQFSSGTNKGGLGTSGNPSSHNIYTDVKGESQAHNHGDTGFASTLQPSMNLNWMVKAEMIVENGSKVYNGLDSSSTVDALSAAQGKALNNKITNRLSLSGGTMTGEIFIGQGDGRGIQLGTQGRINATVDGASNLTVLGLASGKLLVGTTGLPLSLRGKTTVPTYNEVYLIETGSNDNGQWIKFVDGTMICRHTKSVSVNCASQWGNLYEGQASLGNMPATFTSVPTVMATNTQPDGYLEGVRSSSKTSWGDVKMALPSATTRTFNINLVAIGTWK